MTAPRSRALSCTPMRPIPASSRWGRPTICLPPRPTWAFPTTRPRTSETGRWWETPSRVPPSREPGFHVAMCGRRRCASVPWVGAPPTCSPIRQPTTGTESIGSASPRRARLRPAASGAQGCWTPGAWPMQSTRASTSRATTSGSTSRTRTSITHFASSA